VAAVDRIELRDVYEAYAGYVWNTLRRLGVPETDLEDMTQDVFIRVQRHLHEYDPSRPMKPWLFGFAYRVVGQNIRKWRRRGETPAPLVEAIDPTPLVDERLVMEQNRRLVLKALTRIDLKRRALFVLHEIDGVSIEEIARAMEIPVNTAYSRLRVARAEFRAAVERLRRGER
jgi:RNA polymerase sigma-70 factor (ECF subfamily)